MRNDVSSLSGMLAKAQHDQQTPNQTVQMTVVRPLAPAVAPVTPAAASAEGAPEVVPGADPIAMEPTELDARLNATFSGERINAEWAASSERRAKTKMSAVLPHDSALVAVDCRASMCKVASKHANAANYRQFVQDAFSNPATEAWNAGFFSTATADPRTGEISAVAYVAREGEELPAVN
jgi:hypothetical protein